MGDLTAELVGIYSRAVARCDPAVITRAAVSVRREHLVVQSAARTLELPCPTSVAVLTAGKGAEGQARAFGEILPRISRGLCVVPEATGPPPAGFEVSTAGHPLPDGRSIRAGEAALALARSVPRDGLLLCGLSGGTSALLALPAGDLSLADVAATTAALLSSGLDIHAINTVRKHLSAIKGGRLAAACPGTVVSVLLSDVPGGQPDAIGSGPTASDSSTAAGALEVLRRASISVPAAITRYLSNPEDHTPGDLPNSHVCVIAGPEALATAAVEAAEGLRVADTVVESASRSVSEIAAEVVALARRARGRRIWVWVREPTLAVPARAGRGGRNGHLALEVARGIAGAEGVAFLACGSDGIDGNSSAAGAVVDGTTWARAGAPEAALAGFDSAPVHQRLGTAVITGPTGTNFMDLNLLAVDRP